MSNVINIRNFLGLNLRNIEDKTEIADFNLPKGPTQELSPCCGIPLSYEFGTGNPLCSNCKTLINVSY